MANVDEPRVRPAKTPKQIADEQQRQRAASAAGAVSASAPAPAPAYQPGDFAQMEADSAKYRGAMREFRDGETPQPAARAATEASRATATQNAPQPPLGQQSADMGHIDELNRQQRADMVMLHSAGLSLKEKQDIQARMHDRSADIGALNRVSGPRGMTFSPDAKAQWLRDGATLTAALGEQDAAAGPSARQTMEHEAATLQAHYADLVSRKAAGFAGDPGGYAQALSMTPYSHRAEVAQAAGPAPLPSVPAPDPALAARAADLQSRIARNRPTYTPESYTAGQEAQFAAQAGEARGHAVAAKQTRDQLAALANEKKINEAKAAAAAPSGGVAAEQARSAEAKATLERKKAEYDLKYGSSSLASDQDFADLAAGHPEAGSQLVQDVASVFESHGSPTSVRPITNVFNSDQRKVEGLLERIKSLAPEAQRRVAAQVLSKIPSESAAYLSHYQPDALSLPETERIVAAYRAIAQLAGQR